MNTLSKILFQFVKKFSESEIYLWHHLYSVIVSLFTNISLDETINFCVDLIFHKNKKAEGMLKQHFKQLLRLSVKSYCLLFNSVYYKQVDGIATVSPLGPIFFKWTMTINCYKSVPYIFDQSIIGSMPTTFLSCLKVEIMKGSSSSTLIHTILIFNLLAKKNPTIQFLS